MGLKKSEPMAQKKPVKAKKEDTSLTLKETSIITVEEMPRLSEMNEGRLYVSVKDLPQVRMKIMGKIIKFKLEV